MMANNPSVTLRGNLDSPNRSQIYGFDNPATDRKKDTSILLDKDERELVKRGDEVTKEEMWALLEEKRFIKLKEATVNLQSELICN